ncbi:MAG: hypothetical protein PWP40_1253 [Rhodocyclaceae bacterium]|nr:hypothetical protein [Rhodocyclaceae bacterium]
MSRLSERVRKLEGNADRTAPNQTVGMYFKDASGTWRNQRTGEPLPTETERIGLFAIRIGAPADFDEAA